MHLCWLSGIFRTAAYLPDPVVIKFDARELLHRLTWLSDGLRASEFDTTAEILATEPREDAIWGLNVEDVNHSMAIPMLALPDELVCQSLQDPVLHICRGHFYWSFRYLMEDSESRDFTWHDLRAALLQEHAYADPRLDELCGYVG